ncbi:guanine nucleotide-binding protein G(q) subunit alpha [Paragonimus westermani]|uniref:Guanine nucleotide-binding protein G(Q) subunit alpha n=1 Tax=Paragonimus westermani TaxID=34504 RepID=A0A5J4NVE5_9TREM|nr:guanine nucleotide-binding protein G(q) subunit alpha [Paragonimus westermani]
MKCGTELDRARSNSQIKLTRFIIQLYPIPDAFNPDKTLNSVELVVDSVKQNAELISKVDPENTTTLDVDVVTAIRRLWADPGMKECFQRRREFQITDSSKYRRPTLLLKIAETTSYEPEESHLSHLYWDNFDRIVAPDYLPTLQDILRVRVPTTGIVEYPFNLNSTLFRQLLQRALAPFADVKSQ